MVCKAALDLWLADPADGGGAAGIGVSVEVSLYLA